MSQLNILRQLSLHKNLLTVPFTLKQQQILNLSRCAVFRQRVKTSSSDGDGSKSLQSSDHTGRTDISTDVRPLGEKIKENTKTASYMAIVLAGIGITGVMFWAIFRELFSSSSPNNIYSDALDRVKNDPRVQDNLGAPIKGYGEESRRGRRQHVAHSLYDRNGVPHMRMQFYVRGIRNKGTVYLEARKNPLTGKQDYRYLFVQMDHYPNETIVLEDNRMFDADVASSSQSESHSEGLKLTAFGK